MFKETLNHKETFQATFQDEDLDEALVWSAFPKSFGLYYLLRLTILLGNAAQVSKDSVNFKQQCKYLK